MAREGEVGTEDVGGGGGGTAGGEGGGAGDPGAVDLEKVAADFDAEALAALKEQDEGEAGAGDGTEGKGGAPKPGASNPWKEFVDQNYQGNEAAAVAGLYESRNEQRRLATELDNLKAKVEGTGAPPRNIEAEAKAIRDADPDVQSLDREIKSTEARNQAILTRQNEIVDKVQTLAAEITALEAELPHLDDPKEVSKKTAELGRKSRQHDSLVSEFNTNELRMEKNRDKITVDKRELKKAEKDIRDRLEAQQMQAADDAKGAERTFRAFNAAFDHYIKPYGVDVESKKGKFAREATRTQLADYLESLGDDAEGLDAAGIFEATQKLIAAYADAHDMKPVGAAGQKPPAAPPKRPLQLPPRPAGARAEAAALRRPASTPRTPDDVLSNPDLVRQRARAVFQAAAMRGRRAG